MSAKGSVKAARSIFELVGAVFEARMAEAKAARATRAEAEGTTERVQTRCGWVNAGTGGLTLGEVRRCFRRRCLSRTRQPAKGNFKGNVAWSADDGMLAEAALRFADAAVGRGENWCVLPSIWM